MSANIKKILRELKRGLVAIYGDQLKAVVLFGSYARGDAHPPDSDIDVMLVLKGEFKYGEVQKRSSEFVAALCLEHEIVISRVFVSEAEYAQGKTPLMLNILKEGVAV
ncbi:MAG: nucleotidyltransferase domain-containing protein [Anaerolineales bacterium]